MFHEGTVYGRCCHFSRLFLDSILVNRTYVIVNLKTKSANLNLVIYTYTNSRSIGLTSPQLTRIPFLITTT